MKKNELRQQALKLVNKRVKVKNRIVVSNRRHSRTKSHIKLMYEKLKKGEVVYLSTKNREWFKWRFNDANKQKIVMHKVGESLYKLSL